MEIQSIIHLKDDFLLQFIFTTAGNPERYWVNTI